MIQKILFALSDPTRREILKVLRRGERAMGEICERFDVSPPAISRHLCILRDAGLVESRREGKFIYYTLQTDAIELIRDWLGGLLAEVE